MSLRFFASMAAASIAALYAYAASTFVYHGSLRRYLYSFNPERAHRIAVMLSKPHLAAPRLPFVPHQRDSSPRLLSHVCALPFYNPVVLASGFEKHAEAMFGFFHVGSVTPVAQERNERSEVFRLTEHRAVL
ncbi:unnamed protein product [Agarophyton chilense]